MSNYIAWYLKYIFKYLLKLQCSLIKGMSINANKGAGNGGGMIVLEMPYEDNDFDFFKGVMSDEYYSIIVPKNVDGEAIIQAVIKLTEICVPALVSYFIGRKSLKTVTWKYKGKVDIEMTAAINNKELSEEKLSKYFYSQVEKCKDVKEYTEGKQE